MTDLHIIIVAAGSGSRFGSPLPKQFCDLCGRPVVMHAIDRLRKSAPEAAMTIVLSETEFGRWEELCRKHDFVSPRVVAGGASRWESVKNALQTVADNTSLVMIHDGARPLVDSRVFDNLLERILNKANNLNMNMNIDGVVPVVAVTDSLRMVLDDCDSTTPVDRSKLRAVQTPQLFYADRLKKAYSMPYSPLFTDDASVMEAADYRIATAQGSPTNIKITNPADIIIAETLIQNKFA